jgi:CBS domain-containing membrane protein
MAPARAPVTPALRNFDPADLDAALDEYNQVLSINREDLEDLIQRTELQSFRRMSGALTCAQIMTANPKTVHFGTDLKEAWALMEKHDIKALPVVTRQKRITGLLNRADFLREAAILNPADPAEGLKRLLERSPTPHSDKPEACGQIMSETWQHLPASAPAQDLVPLLLSLDHPHVLITDEKKHLAGIVAKSDLMRSLAHAV